MEWLYGNPEQGDSEALATWTSVRVSFTAPFLLFACIICFNFVIACRLYCFNVDVFVFGKKLLRAYVFCLYYMPNWNKVFTLLTWRNLKVKQDREITVIFTWYHGVEFMKKIFKHSFWQKCQLLKKFYKRKSLFYYTWSWTMVSSEWICNVSFKVLGADWHFIAIVMTLFLCFTKELFM